MREAQAELASTPQNVFGGVGPFLPHQVGGFTFGEIGAKNRPEVAHRARIAEHPRDLRSIRAHETQSQAARQIRMSAQCRPDERFEAVVRKIAAWKRDT